MIPSERAPVSGRAHRRRLRTTEIRAESLALGAAGAVVGLVVGLVLLRGTAPLSGPGSIGQIAALSTLAVSGLVAACSLAVLAPRRHPWMRALPWWRRALAVLGPGLRGPRFPADRGHVAVLQQAFLGVALDRFASTFWVSLRARAPGRMWSAPVRPLSTVGRSRRS